MTRLLHDVALQAIAFQETFVLRVHHSRVDISLPAGEWIAQWNPTEL